jgi:hypothetical protein
MGYKKFAEPISIALCITLVAMSKKNRKDSATNFNFQNYAFIYIYFLTINSFNL